MKKIFVAAIDGPAASGKSSAARKLAARIGGVFISTGSMYRAAALKAVRTNTPIEPGPAMEELMKKTVMRFPETDELEMDGERIPDALLRSEEVSSNASKIAVIPCVRKRLVEMQREMLSGDRILVMEGRDIGSVVFPDAKWKFYLTATPEARARRRLMQDTGSVSEAEVRRVAAGIAARDQRDMTRTESPLVQAPDAVFLDNSAMTLEETVDFLENTIRRTL